LLLDAFGQLTHVFWRQIGFAAVVQFALVAHSRAVPTSATDAVEPPGPADTIRVAERAAIAPTGGLKATVIKHVAFAAKVEPHVLADVCRKSPGLSPAICPARPAVAPARDSPVFVTVNANAAPIVPSVAVPKLWLAGARVRDAGVSPLPVRLAVTWPPGVAEACRVPVRSPETDGANLTATVQDAFTDRVDEQAVLTTWKSVAPVLIVADGTPVDPVPLFATVNVKSALSCPTVMEPNPCTDGEIDSEPPTHVPALHCGVDGVAAQSELVQHLSAAIQAVAQALKVAAQG
jgi:hypothetical protein